MELAEIIAELGKLAQELQVILDAQGAPTEEQMSQAEELVKRIDDLETKKAKLEKLAETKSANQERIKLLKTPVNQIKSASQAGSDDKRDAALPRVSRKSKYYPDEETAFKAGRFFQAMLGNSAEAREYCESKGVNFKALQSNIEGGAGLFVLPEIETAVLRLVEEYSIIRQEAYPLTTTQGSYEKWKRVSGNTAYFLSETGQPTSTDATWMKLTLTPKVIGALTKYSLILNADSAVNLADEVTQELAYAISVLEEQAAFIGDGTSTYGGIVGLSYAFKKLVEDGGGTWTTDADKQKLGAAVLAAGNTFAEFTLQNFIDTKNRLARYPGIKPKWYIHDVAAAASMERLQYALSGNAVPNITEGLPAKFLGYPVVYVNAMPKDDANSQVACLFGDLKMASYFCERQGIEIATNTQSETNFLTRTAQVLATERIDFMVHDLGNYNATAASRTRGAVAALISMNS